MECRPRPPLAPFVHVSLLVCVLSSFASAKEIRVGPVNQADFPTISQAIAAANDGDVIRVAPGTYAEPLVIGKSIEIVGTGISPKDVVIESSQKSAVRMTAGAATVRRVWLKGGGDYPDEQHPAHFVVAVPLGKLTLVDCKITSVARGEGSACAGARGRGAELHLDQCDLTDPSRNAVRVFDNAGVTVTHCEIAGASHSNLAIDGSTAFVYRTTIRKGHNGILARYGAKLHVVECLFFDNALTPIRVVKSKVTMERCKAGGGKTHGGGAILSHNTEGDIIGCEFSENVGNGLDIHTDADITLRHCVIRSNGSFGVHVYKSATPTIEECWIYQNKQSGVHVYGQARSTVTKCRIFGNGVSGVYCGNEAEVVVSDCDMRDQVWQDVWVQKDGLGTVENCRMHGGNYGVNASDGGRVLVRNCHITGKNFAGVTSRKHGLARVGESTITDNLDNGVFVTDNGDIYISHTLISNNKGPGIRTAGKATGVVEDCNLMSNDKGPYVVDGDGEVEFLNNEE